MKLFSWLFCRKKQRKLFEFKDEIERCGLHEVKQITKLMTTKYKEQVLLYYPEELESVFQIRLYNGVKTNRINLIVRAEEMKIADLQVLGKGNISRGYGTLLLVKALHLAKNKGVKFVTGNLYSEDKENYGRQINFYSKYNFRIKGSHIRLDL